MEITAFHFYHQTQKLKEQNCLASHRLKIWKSADGFVRTVHCLELEKEICKFFNISSIDEPPKIHVNARQPLKTTTLDASQIAWCVRGAKIAATVHAEKYNHNALLSALSELRGLADFPDKIKNIPKFLSEIGIRFVIIEPLPHSPIDGAAFWLADDAPVILLSARYDRMDCFWFTLAHELSHIVHRDSQSVDSDLVGESSSRDLEDIEKRANEQASSFLIPSEKIVHSCSALSLFIQRRELFNLLIG